MARSVVLAGTGRCPLCLLPPRWCICGTLQPVVNPLQVGVLFHRREQWRPTSTGKLIERIFSNARTHVFQRDRPWIREEIVASDRELWILHPRGEPLSGGAETAADPARIQVLLLDGSWGEAGQMLRQVEKWGRPIRLPLPATSRYWLREQQGEGQLSTVEALLGLLAAIRQPDAEALLRLHFELHVYASLRARGQKAKAALYLENSPLLHSIPHVLDQLHQRRPNPSTPRTDSPLSCQLPEA
jgi:DTW domain-containing protein YfiP